ncbi:MAG: right-handed parallel beta-helix repeat-containing protein, partial [Clostridia bacterium]|nr:right-handed parallel beta-helix repeat-containing protein [Clostridia bacterium]
FTSCKGQLVLENCEASWHGDDFVNVHAYYQDVVGVEGEKTYYIQEKTPDGTHAQTLDYPDTGDVMELVSRKTLEKVGEYRVLDCEPLPDKWMCRVTLDRPLPAEREGLMLADITRLPDVTVRGCRISSHFARSILLKNRSALVENCIFENAHGAGVVAAAESWWSEGVCPSNITVRNNIIKNCGVFGSEGAIVVKADCDDPHGKNIFNINIENNSIDCPSCRYGILVRNADGVRITGNTANVWEDAVKTVDCSNVEIK